MRSRLAGPFLSCSKRCCSVRGCREWLQDVRLFLEGWLDTIGEREWIGNRMVRRCGVNCLTEGWRNVTDCTQSRFKFLRGGGGATFAKCLGGMRDHRRSTTFLPLSILTASVNPPSPNARPHQPHLSRNQKTRCQGLGLLNCFFFFVQPIKHLDIKVLDTVTSLNHRSWIKSLEMAKVK